MKKGLIIVILAMALFFWFSACTTNEYTTEDQLAPGDNHPTVIYYADKDNDGYGAGAAHVGWPVPKGFVTNNLDCNDDDPAINPSASEVPDNSVDENCDKKFEFDFIPSLSGTNSISAAGATRIENFAVGELFSDMAWHAGSSTFITFDLEALENIHQPIISADVYLLADTSNAEILMGVVDAQTGDYDSVMSCQLEIYFCCSGVGLCGFCSDNTPGGCLLPLFIYRNINYEQEMGVATEENGKFSLKGNLPRTILYQQRYLTVHTQVKTEGMSAIFSGVKLEIETE